jgi:hypothetical protein
LGLASALWVTLGTIGHASAYCRTSACSGNVAGQRCVPAQSRDCGSPLYRTGLCFGFSVHETGSNKVDVATVEALMDQAFTTWEQADCGGGAHPSVSVENIGRVACDRQEYNQTGGNTNLIVFRDDVWPYENQAHTLALTTVTYNLDTGEIYDADLEVNSTDQVNLTISDSDVGYDLLSVLTHEAGHMLGLAHSPQETATMHFEALPGETQLRDLDPDDVEGICVTYPPGRAGSCDTTPRHGFASECGGADADDESCSLARAPLRAGDQKPTSALVGVVSLVALALARRRRRRR